MGDNGIIRYVRTSLAKQVFLCMCFLWVLLRFVIMMEIIIYKLDNYYERTNVPLTILMYFVLFAIVIFLMVGHRFFGVKYDDGIIVYENRILRKNKSLAAEDVKRAVLDKRKITLFTRDKNLEIPFFRLGKMDAVQANDFYLYLKNRNDVEVEKRFGVMPGYEKAQKVYSAIYIILSILVFMSYATPIKVIIVLYQAHR